MLLLRSKSFIRFQIILLQLGVAFDLLDLYSIQNPTGLEVEFGTNLEINLNFSSEHFQILSFFTTYF